MRAPSGYLRLPPEASRMQPNQGIEALAVLQAGPLKGSVVAFAERFTRGSGYHTGWIWVRGEPQRIQLQDIDGFNITDAAALPDGGLLVLERYFRWTEGVKMRIRHLAAAEIVPGARLTGRTLHRGGLRLRDRQHGRHGRASRAARRDGRLADLRRQLQHASCSERSSCSSRWFRSRRRPCRARTMTANEVRIRHTLRPGDLGMIVHLHGVLYAREYGLDTTFEPYVAKPLADFVLAGNGRLWVAELDDRIVGSIAVVDADNGEGQLRWFLLAPEARGTGARPPPAGDGARLLPRAPHAARVPVELFRSRRRAGALRARGLQGHGDPHGERVGQPSAPRCAWT